MAKHVIYMRTARSGLFVAWIRFGFWLRIVRGEKAAFVYEWGLVACLQTIGSCFHRKEEHNGQYCKKME